MKKNIAIRVLSEFTRENKIYLLFTLKSTEKKEHSFQYLYFSKPGGAIASLLFGKDFRSKITNLLQQKDSCIECSLGVDIAGGISKDSGEVVEHGMTIKRANEILKKLQEKTDRRIAFF